MGWMRRQSRVYGPFIMAALVLMFGAGTSRAASSFSSHVWQFANGAGVGTNLIDLNKGGSRIYDTGNLHIATDDYIYLNAPTETVVERDLGIGNNLHFFNNGNGTTNSQIYNNGDLHIQADNNLMLDAPGTTTIQNNLTIGGDLTLTGSETAAGVRSSNYTGSNPEIDGDLTIQGGAGSSDGTNPAYHAGVAGTLEGNSPTGTANNNGGVIGFYSIAGTDASTFPKGAILGVVGNAGATSGADGAVVAVLDGRSNIVTAGAAFKVLSNNSSSSSGFSYGLDLEGAAHDGYLGISYSAADIRLANGVAILSGTGAPASSGAASNNCNLGAGKPALPLGSLYLNASGGTNTSLYLCTATNTWTAK